MKHNREILHLGRTNQRLSLTSSTAMNALIRCNTCDLAQWLDSLPEGQAAYCSRCGNKLRSQNPHSAQITAALSLTALILYVPANAFPVIEMNQMGRQTSNTIMEGCLELARNGEWFVGTVVFLASIIIPFLKIAGMLWLTLARNTSIRPKIRMRLHRFIEISGPWAMLDVFLVAILISLVKFERLANVSPGEGLWYFTLVVVLTLFAARFYDPRQIWKNASAPSS